MRNIRILTDLVIGEHKESIIFDHREPIIDWQCNYGNVGEFAEDVAAWFLSEATAWHCVKVC